MPCNLATRSPDPLDAPLFTDIADAPDGGVAHWVTTADGKRLRFAIWGGGNKGTVLIFPGRTEYIEKYGRVVGKLARRGYSSVVIDWRGQGLSDRPGDNTDRGHVDDFREYQLDVAAVLVHEAVQALPGPRTLLAHSMGGCIGLRALQTGLGVSGAIFSAPMWGMGLSWPLYALARGLSGPLTMLGFGMVFAPTTNEEHYIPNQPFEDNVLTNDPEVYDWLKRQLAAHPELGLGGPTICWIHRAMQETRALMAMPPPMQMLTFLGDEENVVNPKAVTGYMAKPGAGELVICPNAKHEILMESGPVLDLAWTKIDELLGSIAA